MSAYGERVWDSSERRVGFIGVIHLTYIRTDCAVDPSDNRLACAEWPMYRLNSRSLVCYGHGQWRGFLFVFVL